MQQDSTFKTISVAAILCIACSVLVSTAAVKLKPIQNLNKKLDIQKKLLLTSGLLDNPKATASEISEAYKSVVPLVIDFETGEVVTEIGLESFDQKKAAKDPKLNKMIDPNRDIAKIKRRSKNGRAYLIKKDGAVDQIVLPVHGKGLWSTMYGFIALGRDTKTIRGFGFYAHGETPGLGGEVDNPNWKKQWTGKIALDEANDYQPMINVIKGTVDKSNPKAASQIDGLSGATITSVGVQHLVNYWLGSDAYGAFLSKVRNEGMSL